MMNKLAVKLAFAFLLLGVGTTASAVPPGEAIRIQNSQTLAGGCCFSWGETVTVTEPRALVPVVVSLSADYFSAFEGFIGISVNNRPCTSLQGWERSAPAEGTFNVWSFDWVVFPGDGLFKGDNTITLCGGSDHAEGSIILGFNSLAARIAK